MIGKTKQIKQFCEARGETCRLMISVRIFLRTQKSPLSRNYSPAGFV